MTPTHVTIPTLVLGPVLDPVSFPVDAARPSSQRPRTARTRDERGAIALEFLLTITVLVAVFLLMLQYAVRAHASQITSAAASEGLAATAAYDGTVATGERVARSYLDKLTPRLHNPTITITRTPTTVTVTVAGDVDQMIPFMPVHVSVHLEGPVERFTSTPAGTP